MTINNTPERRFVRLYETNDIQELSLIKLSLDQAEISYHTLFEHTMHTANAAAMGGNGAVVEVLLQDYFKAKMILKEMGIELGENSAESQFEFVEQVADWTNKWPVIGGLPKGQRFFVVLMFFLLLAFLVFSWWQLRTFA